MTDFDQPRPSRRQIEAMIRPLEWSSKGYAKTPWGNYVVAETSNLAETEKFWFVYFAGKTYGRLGEHPSEASAKIACEQDHTRRILSALSIEE